MKVSSQSANFLSSLLNNSTDAMNQQQQNSLTSGYQLKLNSNNPSNSNSSGNTSSGLSSAGLGEFGMSFNSLPPSQFSFSTKPPPSTTTASSYSNARFMQQLANSSLSASMSSSSASSNLLRPTPSISPTTLNKIKNNLAALNSQVSISLTNPQQAANNSFANSLRNSFSVGAAASTSNCSSSSNSSSSTAAAPLTSGLQPNASTLIASVMAANTASAFSQIMPTTCNLNNTLFVGNLHASLQEIDLIQVFRPFGRIVECCKKWLHFGFVKFTTEEEACHAYITLNGFRLKGRPMRLEFQNRTKKARIKAILAQAALQAANCGGSSFGTDALESSLASLGFSAIFSDDRPQHNTMSSSYFQQQQQQQAPQYHQSHSASSSYHQHNSQHQQPPPTPQHSSTFLNNSSFFMPDNLSGKKSSDFESSSSLLNQEQLIKFASSSSLLSLSSLSEEDARDAALFNFDMFSNNLFDLTEEAPHTTKSSSSSSIGVNSSSSDEDSVHYLSAKNHLDIMTCLSKKQPTSASSSDTHSPAALSPSPQHHDTSSSDSGCRSASFSNDEDSGACSGMFSQLSLKSLNCDDKKEPPPPPAKLLGGSKQLSASDAMIDCCSISEHLEFTCSSNSDTNNKKQTAKVVVAASYDDSTDSAVDEEEEIEEDTEESDDHCDNSSDTSDDASVMPADSECLNELDLDDHFAAVEPPELSRNSANYNQVLQKDGTMLRQKLDIGIYQSVNQTLSLFVEPHDILRQLDADEYEEYTLFPQDAATKLDEQLDMIESYTELNSEIENTTLSNFLLA